jgi:uncharacterized protein
MEFTLDQPKTSYIIKRYTAHAITVNQTEYTQSLIVGPTTLITDWKPQHLADLKMEDFDPILKLNPSVVLLGVGEKHQFPDPALLKPFYQRNIGVEVMTTPAACRTFNVLIAEDRAVVAILLKA